MFSGIIQHGSLTDITHSVILYILIQYTDQQLSQMTNNSYCNKTVPKDDNLIDSYGRLTDSTLGSMTFPLDQMTAILC